MSELRLAGVLDAAREPMLVFDAAGCILFFNRACERLFGRSAAEVAGRPVAMLMRGAAASAVGDDVAAYLGRADIGTNACFLDSDGHELTVDLSLSTVADAAGTQHLLVLRARGDARAPAPTSELMRAARLSALEEVSAAVVHKLNQPLTALTLYLQAIERVHSRATSGGVLPEAVLSILEKSAHEAERASSMLQQLRQSFDQEGAAVVVKTRGVAGQGEAPNALPEDEQREHGGDAVVSRAIAQDRGGDSVVDSGERERVTRFTPAVPARVSAPPAQEEQGKWVNV